MSALASDYLLFKMAGGKSVAFSAEMVSVEPAGGAAELFDQEFLTHATKAVFHYFKHELRRQTVSVGEFASALEKVLRGFALTGQAAARTQCAPRVLESDLRRLACESGKGCELFFFPAASSNWPAHDAGPRVAAAWTTKSWLTSAPVSAPRPSPVSWPWSWIESCSPAFASLWRGKPVIPRLAAPKLRAKAGPAVTCLPSLPPPPVSTR